jgi:hypothetical protein
MKSLQETRTHLNAHLRISLSPIETDAAIEPAGTASTVAADDARVKNDPSPTDRSSGCPFEA